MPQNECVRKNCCGPEKKHLICILVTTTVVLMANFIVRPWNYLPLDAFIGCMVISLIMIVLAKICEMCVCGFDDMVSTPATLNTFYFYLCFIWLLSMVDGF